MDALHHSDLKGQLILYFIELVVFIISHDFEKIYWLTIS
jgi:hypothetical protein